MARQDQLSQVVLQEFNNFLMRELELPSDCLATVTKVDVTNDLKNAFIFLSVLPINRAGSVLELMNRNLGEAARFLAKRLKLRIVPKLFVKIDDTELKYRKIERELDNLE